MVLCVPCFLCFFEFVCYEEHHINRFESLMDGVDLVDSKSPIKSD